MNWGYRIVLAYLVFMVILGVMAYKSFNSKVNLVAQDYYRQELAYQEQIDKMANAANLKQPLTMELVSQNNYLEITFPPHQQDLKGTVTLYRPSNAQMDRVWKLKVNDQHQQSIPLNSLARGLWKVKIEWQAEGKSYYQQKNIYLP